LIKGAVEGFVAGVVRRISGELEEEDDAVDGVELGEGIRVQGKKLLELDIFNAEVVKQVGEDTLGFTRQLSVHPTLPLGLELVLRELRTASDSTVIRWSAVQLAGNIMRQEWH
jgi:hypothetical protein